MLLSGCRAVVIALFAAIVLASILVWSFPGWICTAVSYLYVVYFFFSSRRRHTRFDCDWSSDVCSSDLFPRFSSNLPRCIHVAAGQRTLCDPTFLKNIRVGEIENGFRFHFQFVNPPRARSEERRVGKEGRSRWSPDH